MRNFQGTHLESLRVFSHYGHPGPSSYPTRLGSNVNHERRAYNRPTYTIGLRSMLLSSRSQSPPLVQAHRQPQPDNRSPQTRSRLLSDEVASTRAWGQYSHVLRDPGHPF